MSDKVNVSCTKCGQVYYRVSVKWALRWLSCDPETGEAINDPDNPHDCWTPKTPDPPVVLEDPIDCYFCGEVFDHADFVKLGEHVWSDCCMQKGEKKWKMNLLVPEL